MRRVAKICVLVLALFPLPALSQGQKRPEQSSPLTQPTGSVGNTKPQPPKVENPLTTPTAPVVPSEQFQEGQISEDVASFKDRLARLESQMGDVLGYVGFAKGAFWVITGAVAIFLIIMKLWWKPIVRSIVKDSYAEDKLN